MHLLVFVTLVMLAPQIVHGQNNAGYVVKAGQVPDRVLPKEVLYLLPSFTQGIVYLRNGQASQQQLNYNIMLNEMQFLGARGDTLAIAEPETIQQIRIGQIHFTYDKTYLQIIDTVQRYSIAIHQFFVQTPFRTKGGYGTSTGASAITTYTSMGFGGRPATSLQVDKDVAFQKMANFYIGDPFHHFYKADKKSFLHIFAEHKSSIETYFREHKVNFLDPIALRQALEFCTRQ